MTRTTISSRLENLFGCANDTARFTACLVATGHAHEHTCPRCGGTGIFGHYGVCFNCQGQPARMRSWRTPRLTRVLEAEVAKRWPLVKHLIGNGSTFSAIARESSLIERWARNGGPLTPAEWVEREGAKVADRLIEIARNAASDREYREREAAEKARWNEGAVNIPGEYHGTRREITGEVVTLKEQHTGYGYGSYSTLKCLIKVTHGDGWFKLWGTVPSALENVERGSVISFAAKIEISADDEKFGFYSRPTKARKGE